MTLRYKVVKEDSRTSTNLMLPSFAIKKYKSDSIVEDYEFLGIFIFDTLENAAKYVDFDEIILKVETLEEERYLEFIPTYSTEVVKFLTGKISYQQIASLYPAPDGTMVCKKIKVV